MKPTHSVEENEYYAARYRFLMEHPDEAASAVADAYAQWEPGADDLLPFSTLLESEVQRQIRRLANATYMVEVWNNNERVLCERDALAEALRMVVDDCDVRAFDGRRLPIMPGTEAVARAALASLERKEG